MSRIARIVLEDVPFHITQRGNGRQQIFFEDQDYLLYLDMLRLYSQDVDLRLWAYCLMPNHIHLIAVPKRASSMASAMARINSDFARFFNLKRRSCGHVWQARYFSTPLDETHLWRAMAYIERNPVRANLAESAEEYGWSSAQVRKSDENSALIDLDPWRQRYDWPRWQNVLRTSIDEEALGLRLMEASRRGRPLGDAEFTDELEKRCGRCLRALPVGRPRKKLDREEGQLSLGNGI